MALKENDFVEIDFTGRLETGEVFDSSIKEDLEEINKFRKSQNQNEIDPKPFRFALGQGMFLKGIDEFLKGKPEPRKSEGKDVYNVTLPPEKAFGKRKKELIQMMPIKTFREHGINPVQGASFNFDGRQGKVLTVSGGRVIVDFNNPLAGKPVEYKINLHRKIEDVKEKVDTLNHFFFRKEIPFNIEPNKSGKNKKVILDFEKMEPQFKQIAKMFKEKYTDLLGLEVEMKGIEDDETPKTSKEESKEKEGKKE